MCKIEFQWVLVLNLETNVQQGRWNVWVGHRRASHRGLGAAGHVTEGIVLVWRVWRTSLGNDFYLKEAGWAVGAGRLSGADSVCTLGQLRDSWGCALQREMEGGRTGKGIHWWKWMVPRFSLGLIRWSGVGLVLTPHRYPLWGKVVGPCFLYGVFWDPQEWRASIYCGYSRKPSRISVKLWAGNS